MGVHGEVREGGGKEPRGVAKSALQAEATLRRYSLGLMLMNKGGCCCCCR